MGLKDTLKKKMGVAGLEEENATLKETNERLESLLTPEMKEIAAVQERMIAIRKQYESFQTIVKNLEQQKAQLSTEIEFMRKSLREEGKRKNAELDQELDAKRRKYREDAKQEKINIEREICNLKNQLRTFDDAVLVQDYGLYTPRFDFANSSQYKDALKRCRESQRQCVLDFIRSADLTTWTVNGKASDGKRMVRQFSKLIMRAYNGECDEIVRKVSATNVAESIQQVYKTATSINKQCSVIGVEIPREYQELKEKEVRLAYEYALKKEKEREDIRAAREEERERRKLEKEIAEARKKLEKERKQYLTAYKDVSKRLKEATDEERAELQEKADELKAKLDDVDFAVKDVDYREANQKAGFVYVISNVGSFGEGVYKIGMTRRLDPMERIRELGDASVPFNFDVHALIFCDDAPKLEAALHREFESKKLNLVNQRREFFKVSLEEIERVVKRNYDKTVEFIVVPEAEQYRTSEELRKRGIYSCRR